VAAGDDNKFTPGKKGKKCLNQDLPAARQEDVFIFFMVEN